MLLPLALLPLLVVFEPLRGDTDEDPTLAVLDSKDEGGKGGGGGGGCEEGGRTGTLAKP